MPSLTCIYYGSLTLGGLEGECAEDSGDTAIALSTGLSVPIKLFHKCLKNLSWYDYKPTVDEAIDGGITEADSHITDSGKNSRALV